MTEDKNIIKVSSILLRRGTKEALETKLVGDNKPLVGEMIFQLPSTEHPAGILKVGDGVNDYKDLSPIPDIVLLNKYLSDTLLARNTAVEASASAQNSATIAENAQISAERAAQDALKIPQKTMTQVTDYMNKKIQFLSISEYNALTEIDPDAIMFIRIED